MINAAFDSTEIFHDVSLKDVNCNNDHTNSIIARNLCYSHGSRQPNSLSNLNLTIKKGVIYGLLGPSGCGKTTLLRCLVGLIQPQSGYVRVFGFTPGTPECKIPGTNVGYMPQDLALYENLTLGEVLRYFGRLYFMSNHRIKTRVNELTKILDLPLCSRTVGTLSGGQKRRASFAVSVIHEPPLLILDEPTTGVDPVIRENVWRDLLHLCKKNQTTIIITTQYIDEAKSAHKVGFMRKGKLILEGPPKKLMSTYESKSLEDAFLEACVRNEQTTVENIHIIEKGPLNGWFEDHHPKPNVSRKSTFAITKWLHLFSVLFWSDILRDLRSTTVITFQYIIPVLTILSFALCLGRTPTDIPLAVVNEDPESELTNMFLDQIDSSVIHLLNYENISDALVDIRKLKIWGVIRLKANFSDAFFDRYTLFQDLDSDLLDDWNLRVNADLTNAVISLSTLRRLTLAHDKFMSKLVDYMGQSPFLARSPVEIAEPLYGNETEIVRDGFRNFMLPGIVINITFAIGFYLTGFTLITERNHQTFERNFVAGVSSSQILLAHISCRFLLMAPYVIVIVWLPTWVFDVPLKGSALTLVALLLLVSLLGFAFGIVLATVCPDVSIASVLATGTGFITLIVSGLLWPLESIPHWFRWISLTSPMTFPGIVFRHIMYKGDAYVEKDLCIAISVLCLWIVLMTFVGLRYFKYN